MGFSKLQVAAEPKESTLPAKPSPCVRLCPHQTLSFDRLQRILALPNLMEERFRHKTVNALTATSSPPSHYLHHAETQICGPPPAPQAASRISKAKLCLPEWRLPPAPSALRMGIPAYTSDLLARQQQRLRRRLPPLSLQHRRLALPAPETERPARGQGRLWALGACFGGRTGRRGGRRFARSRRRGCRGGRGFAFTLQSNK